MANIKKDTNNTDLEHVINSDYVSMQSTTLTGPGAFSSKSTGTITAASCGHIGQQVTWPVAHKPLTAASKLTLNGNDSDIVLNGKSMRQWMEGMEERVNWMQLNPALETEWNQLAELGRQYRELEALCTAKAAAWKMLASITPSV